MVQFNFSGTSENETARFVVYLKGKTGSDKVRKSVAAETLKGVSEFRVTMFHDACPFFRETTPLLHQIFGYFLLLSSSL